MHKNHENDIHKTNLRSNEFKVRQHENTRKAIPEQLRAKVLALIEGGASKKALVLILGCTYQDLKRKNLR